MSDMNRVVDNRSIADHFMAERISELERRYDALVDRLRSIEGLKKCSEPQPEPLPQTVTVRIGQWIELIEEIGRFEHFALEAIYGLRDTGVNDGLHDRRVALHKALADMWATRLDFVPPDPEPAR